MQFTRSRTRLLPLLAFALAASGCAERVKTSLAFPPAPDLQAATEPKPVPPDDIVTSDQASADYSAAVEAWGDRVSAAGGRICRWVEDAGGKLPFKCPEPVKP